jgi:hypothetical protein
MVFERLERTAYVPILTLLQLLLKVSKKRNKWAELVHISPHTRPVSQRILSQVLLT